MAIASLVIVEIAFVTSIACLIYGGASVSDSASSSSTGYYIAAACVAVVWLIWNCILFCNWSHLYTAIAIIDAAADFFVDSKRIVLVVLLYFVVEVLVFFYWLGG